MDGIRFNTFDVTIGAGRGDLRLLWFAMIGKLQTKGLKLFKGGIQLCPASVDPVTEDLIGWSPPFVVDRDSLVACCRRTRQNLQCLPSFRPFRGD